MAERDKERIEQLEHVLWEQLPAVREGRRKMAQVCPVHDEAMTNLRDRYSRLEGKVDTIDKNVGKLSLTIAKWSGAVAVIVSAATLAAKYLLPCVVLVVVLTGCGAAPQCTTERAIAAAYVAGIVAADESLGDDVDEETQEALRIAGGVADLGTAAVDACEVLRDGEGWQRWVGLALEASASVLARFPGDVPPELRTAVLLLEAATP